MKKQLLLFVTVIVTLKSYSQLQTTGTIAAGTAYRFGETQINGPLGANNIRGIGIGNFSTLGGGVTPQSRLHVNSFFFPAANLNVTVQNLAGNLFRTDGSNTVENKWQLFTGASAAGSTEKFKLFIPANSTNVGLQATQGKMLFNTGGITTHMIIDQGINGSADGRVALGNNKYDLKCQQGFYAYKLTSNNNIFTGKILLTTYL